MSGGAALTRPPPLLNPTPRTYSLRRRDVRDERVHAEAFGPGSLNRASDKSSAAEPLLPAATVAAPIMFAASGKLARWTPAPSGIAARSGRNARPLPRVQLPERRSRYVQDTDPQGGLLLMRSRHPTGCATARLSFASQSLLRGGQPGRARPSRPLISFHVNPGELI
jgi:hypothetical protein